MQKKNNSNKEKLLGLIGLASRARNLSIGTQLSCDSVRAGKARIVLVATDASPNTKKRVFNCCEYYECACAEIPATTSELGKIAGKLGAVGAVAITEVHFAKGVEKIVFSPVSDKKKAGNRSSEV